MNAGIPRRQLLRLSGLGIASLGLAPWIERAFGDDGARKPRPPSPRSRVLTETWAVARGRGKPMLVLVVPAFRDGDDRGRILAAFLREASEDAHAELALCEVSCAMVAELRALLPEITKEIRGEPMAVLVEPDGKRACAVVEWIHTLPTAKGFEPTSSEIAERKRWVESVAGEFHDAIAMDRAMLGRRADEAVGKLPPGLGERLTGLQARGERWTAPDIAGCPAWALLVARRDEGRREHVAELARISRATLVDSSPRGALWVEDRGGCVAGPCGTAMLPPQSRRFLWLFTKSDP